MIDSTRKLDVIRFGMQEQYKFVKSLPGSRYYRSMVVIARDLDKGFWSRLITRLRALSLLPGVTWWAFQNPDDFHRLERAVNRLIKLEKLHSECQLLQANIQLAQAKTRHWELERIGYEQDLEKLLEA